ncbi:MAG: bifunctional phosphoribosylaminoimidazolecarboxamide formyltransferase/IMP cyclohydrolase [Bacteroidales bacterium]|nr:bifunctional phosphoribosylaminoimidazolecarboxamide formyltransferase/IMP cyclohydrolase [Bacteroidales bacterium]
MMKEKKIKSALISVFYKEGLEEIVRILNNLGVRIISTGGTHDFIKGIGISSEAVEKLTSFPSVLGGRVKTLHPLIFGGILARRDNNEDINQIRNFNIPEIDMVVVELYPFEETVSSLADEAEIIEKIDIGGVALIRAAAKNFNDVLVVSSRAQYSRLAELLRKGNGYTSLEERKQFATEAFSITSGYDVAIFKYFNRERNLPAFRESFEPPFLLRYGENPHQKGIFFGKLEEVFDKLHGKEISYNNLLDIDAALALTFEFSDPAFIITKHTNACGVAERDNIFDAWKDALACDPVSAYGGVLACNRPIDEQAANEIDKLFFEIIISPSYEPAALEMLKHKKNRIILLQKNFNFSPNVFRSNLNGVLWQERDNITEDTSLMQPVTVRVPDKREYDDLVFALKIVKHSKSNAIVLAMNKQLYASGVGQTSRIDALKHAVEKAGIFGFNLNGAVLASDAFFPFADCVEMAHKAGITAIVQPGGSIRDQDSIDFCNKHNIAMVFTGVRHFKH